MIGGLIKSSSRIAMIAAAGIVSGGVAAQAADLGGDCCADLEERVAELEATTARKGNRKVSLTVSGLVNQAVMFFDASGPQGAANEAESNAYIGTNTTAGSRFSFRGQAQINADWSAGFLMEIGVASQNILATDQNTPSPGTGLGVRHEALYIKSKTYGTVWLGQTSSATDGITEICLGCGIGNGDTWDNDGVNLLAENGASYAAHASASGAMAGEGDRRNVVKYISPTFAGFSLSASASGDDYADVALRYAGEFGNIRVAGGVGYATNTELGGTGACGGTSTAASDQDCTLLGASASIAHVPTGLYLYGTYGANTDENAVTDNDTDSSWSISAGVNQKWIALGNTNVYGAYETATRQIGLVQGTASSSSSLDVYTFGVEQDIDAAAMSVYTYYKHLEAEDVDGVDSEADVVFAGAIIKF